jgi:hypothetical protein
MKRIAFIIVLAALLIATTGGASAGTTRTYFTGQANCDPDSVAVARAWMAGPNLQLQGISQLCYDTATIPQMEGIESITFGIVGRKASLTGKDIMVTNEGGVWVGNWEWPASTWTLRIVMEGQGLYAGQQIHIFEDARDGSFWGYIQADTGD